jgi:hypothetical protein
MAAMFVNGSGRNEQLSWRTSIDADKYGCHRQFLFLIGRFLKLLNQMNRNLVGRSSIKIANFVMIH